MRFIEANIDDLKKLYEGSALTFEGCTTDEDNMDYLKDWLVEHDAELIKDEAYIITGKLMNDTFKLKGDRKYPNNLTILSFELDNIKNVENIYMARFELGGRWFDDIVCNNIGGDWKY